MPELPEVETVVRTVRPKLLGRQLVEMRLAPGVRLRQPLPTVDEIDPVLGSSVIGVWRRAKYIVVELGNVLFPGHSVQPLSSPLAIPQNQHLQEPNMQLPSSYSLCSTDRYRYNSQLRQPAQQYLQQPPPTGLIIIHLGMTGSLSFTPAQKHCHATLVFADGGCLYYTDPRRFGSIRVADLRCTADVPPQQLPHHHLYQYPHYAAAIARVIPNWGQLGVEPLDNPQFLEYLEDELLRPTQRLTRSPQPQVKTAGSGTIKSWLLRQDRVVGIGNIYASEILYGAEISPFRRPTSLTRAEVAALAAEIIRVLQAAIEQGGSTIQSYRDGDGAAGRFQHGFAVYGREGAVCRRCCGVSDAAGVAEIAKAAVVEVDTEVVVEAEAECGEAVKTAVARISRVMMAGRATYWCSGCQF